MIRRWGVGSALFHGVASLRLEFCKPPERGSLALTALGAGPVAGRQRAEFDAAEARQVRGARARVTQQQWRALQVVHLRNRDYPRRCK